MTAKTQKVTFTVEHTTRDGKTHKADSTAALSASEARHVLHIGHGRKADASTEATPANTTEGEGR